MCARPLACLHLLPPLGLLLPLWLVCALGPGGCGASGTAPALQISTVLADGRSCRDASVTTIELSFAQKDPPRHICVDTAPPLAIEAVGLPLGDEVEVRGLSAQGALLYRGRFVAAEVLSAPMPAVTVTLYPAVVR